MESRTVRFAFLAIHPLRRDKTVEGKVADFGSHVGRPLADVAFWQTCNQNLKASGDDNCVNFEGARQFAVREDWTVPGKRSVSSPAPPEAVLETRIQASSSSSSSGPVMEARAGVDAPPLAANKKPRAVDNAPWAAEQAMHRRSLNVREATALGSLSPYFDPDVMVKGGFGHGNVSQVFGKTVRWQQVALGIAVGVPLDEWDDAVHVKSDAFVPYGDVASLQARSACGSSADEGTCRSDWALTEREKHEKRWDYARCRSLLTCVRDSVGGSWVKMADGWAQGVQCADRVKAFGSTLYDYVKRYPVTCEIVKLGAGGVVGYGFAQIGSGGNASGQDNDELGRCSNNSQVNAFIEGMLQAANAGDENAARADVTMGNDHILVLYGRVYPRDATPPTNLCPA